MQVCPGNQLHVRKGYYREVVASSDIWELPSAMVAFSNRIDRLTFGVVKWRKKPWKILILREKEYYCVLISMYR